MKKILIAIVAVFSLTIVMTGCGAKREALKPSPEKKALTEEDTYRRALESFTFALRMGKGEIFAIRGDYAEFLRALDRAEASVDEYLFLFPNGPHASEVAFLKARLYDAYLRQDFTRAKDLYRAVIEKYPDTEAARKAGERISLILSIERGMRGTSHDLGGAE